MMSVLSNIFSSNYILTITAILSTVAVFLSSLVFAKYPISNYIFPRKWRERYISSHFSTFILDQEESTNIPYIQPKLVEYSLYHTIDDSTIANSNRILLNDFFIKKVFKKEYSETHVFCILADAGMGKTTAMVNLFIDYINCYNEKTLPYDIWLFSFSDPEIFTKIKAIENKKNCILLLDAVDENFEAQDDASYPDFLSKLEATYRQFARVITTCRPQFFGEGKGEFDETNVRRGSYFVKCQKLYLDYFDEHQVQEYLNQVHTFRSDSPERQKAERIVSVCPDIATRPLVLSYIDPLVKEDKEYSTSCEIYDAIVQKLIRREVAKEFFKDIEKREQQWFALTSLVARHIYHSHPLQPTITQEEIEEIVNAYNEDLSDAEKVDAQKFRERSLLTRFGNEYRFSHKSFYEYLMAYRFFLDWHEIGSLQGMDFAVQIFNELVDAWQEGKEGFAFGGQTFSEAHIADSLHQMGYYHQSLNNFKEAEKDYQAALEIYRRLAQANPNAYEPRVADTLNNLAALHNDMNDYCKAAEEHEEALEIRRRLAQAKPDAYEPDLADTLNNIAGLHDDMNDYGKAAEEYEEALEIYRRLSQANPDTYEPDLAMTLNNLANLHYNMNDYAKAAEEHEEALEIRRRLAQANPDAHEPDLAMTLNNLGNLHRKTNDYGKAAVEHEEALEIRRRLAQANPDAYEPDLANTLNNIAVLHKNMNDYDKAAEEYEEALVIRRRLAQANPDAYEPKLAKTLYNIALLHANQGNLPEAEQCAKESRDLYQKMAERCHDVFDKYVQMAEGLIADILNRVNNPSSSKTINEIHYETITSNIKKKAFLTANSTNQEIIDYTVSEEKLLTELNQYRKQAQIDPTQYLPKVATTLNSLGNLYSEMGDFQEALSYYNKALDIRQEIADQNPNVSQIDMAETMVCLANIQYKLHEYTSARTHYNAALDIYRESDEPIYTAATLLNLSNLCVAQSDYDQASLYAKEALDIQKRIKSQDPNADLSEQTKTIEYLSNIKKESQEFDNATDELRRHWNQNQTCCIRLKSIAVKNLRLFNGLKHEIVFDEKPITILLGDNGSGKTSLLHACSVMMSHYFSAFPNIDMLSFDNNDIHIIDAAHKADTLTVEAQINLSGIDGSIHVHKTEYAINDNIDDTTILKAYSNHVYRKVQSDERITMPIVALYGTERGQINNPQNTKINLNKTFPRWDCYINALESATNFDRFFEWFKNQEDCENRENNTNREYESPTLKTVRHALNLMDSNFSKPRLVNAPLRFVMDDISDPENPKELRIDQMSDGYRIMIAMIADIASRMAEANPSFECSGLKDPLQTPGVVFIDEVDLHLHPKWQRNVLHQLHKIFPNVQFIVTTHSPSVVLGAIDIAQVVRLDNGVIDTDLYLEKFKYDDISRLLLGELFGLDSVRSPQYAEDSKKRNELIDKDHLTSEEKDELDRLDKEMDKYDPSGVDDIKSILNILGKRE